MQRAGWPLILLALSVAAAASAQPGDDSPAALSAALKPLLVTALPSVLYEKEENWGRQAPTPNGVTWHGLHPHVQMAPRNDGRWRKLKITVRDLPRTLDFRVGEFRDLGEDRQQFQVFLAFGVGVDYDQQTWAGGVRLGSAGVRARLRLKCVLDCESVMRLEEGKQFLPDLVFRLRVSKASVSYDEFVVEHVAGLGGTAAKVLGEAAHDCLNQWRPSVERRLLARASAALVKAADTREVRLGLGGISRKKKTP